MEPADKYSAHIEWMMEKVNEERNRLVDSLEIIRGRGNQGWQGYTGVQGVQGPQGILEFKPVNLKKSTELIYAHMYDRGKHTHSEILKWADMHDMYSEDNKYHFNVDGTVNVEGDVFIKSAQSIPFKYGTVNGSFIATGLYTLSGLPKVVSQNCIVTGEVPLPSLNYLPEKVGGAVHVIYPHILFPISKHQDINLIPQSKFTPQDYFDNWEKLFQTVEKTVEELAYLYEVCSDDISLNKQRVDLLHRLFTGEITSKVLLETAKGMGLDIGLSKDFNNISTEALKANHRM